MGSVWVIKRNGEEVEFDAEKISNAIQKANNEVTDGGEDRKSIACRQCRADSGFGRNCHYGRGRIRDCAEICALPLSA